MELIDFLIEKGFNVAKITAEENQQLVKLIDEWAEQEMQDSQAEIKDIQAELAALEAQMKPMMEKRRVYVVTIQGGGQFIGRFEREEAQPDLLGDDGLKLYVFSTYYPMFGNDARFDVAIQTYMVEGIRRASPFEIRPLVAFEEQNS